MDEVQIIQIPCEYIGEREIRLIEILLEVAKALNIDENEVKSPEAQGEAA